jgi:hypothetical protein
MVGSGKKSGKQGKKAKAEQPATEEHSITLHGGQHILVKVGMTVSDAIHDYFKKKIAAGSSWQSKNKEHPDENIKKLKLAKLQGYKEQYAAWKAGKNPVVEQAQGPKADTSAELRSIPAAEKLKLYAALSAEMVRCGLTRTQNNPVGDVAETLFCRALGLNKNDNKASPHVDAIGCNDDLRYQIKGRRLVGSNGARQLSALRDLDGDHFDFLGAVLFNEDFTVRRAAVIPVAVVRNLSRPDEHTRSGRFMRTDAVWDRPQVWDVTDKLRAVDLDAPLTEQALKSAASLWYGERHQ